jgi:hypothetical protein
MGALGRPPGSAFSEAIADEILSRLATGETIRAICKTPGMPTTGLITQWLSPTNTAPGSQRFREDFPKRYAHARAMGLDQMAEQTIEIADNLDEDPASRRVRVDTRKWLLSKLRPDLYGERMAIDKGTGWDGDLTKLTESQLATLIAGLESRRLEAAAVEATVDVTSETITSGGFGGAEPRGSAAEGPPTVGETAAYPDPDADE